jgi:hypothetical protein
MEHSNEQLTELQFTILDGMADDAEDIEQLYLFANRRFAEESSSNIQFPCMLVEVRFALRDICDEMAEMVHEGYIEAKYSNDERIAPLCPLDFTALHHYWFGPTAKGTTAWNGYRKPAKD